MSEIHHGQITILAIDDDVNVLTQITGTLTEAGYCCHCAQDAKGAQEAVGRAVPDLILSDINLAGHSGVTVCEQIKQQAGLGDIPLMFLSAAQVPDIIRRAHRAGGTYYLRKPFDGAVLLRLIEQALPLSHFTPA